jgi:hypothetical protein
VLARNQVPQEQHLYFGQGLITQVFSGPVAESCPYQPFGGSWIEASSDLVVARTRICDVLDDIGKRISLSETPVNRFKERGRKQRFISSQPICLFQLFEHAPVLHKVACQHRPHRHDLLIAYRHHLPSFGFVNFRMTQRPISISITAPIVAPIIISGTLAARGAVLIAGAPGVAVA